MNKAVITVGISASGKSSYAEKITSDQHFNETGEDWVEVNRDWIRFNVVCPGADWSNYKFTKKREADVTEIANEMIQEAFYQGQHVIISDTNLDKARRDKLIEYLEGYNFEVSIKEFPITLEEAIKRDRIRPNGVGEEVIYKQYLKHLEYSGRKTYTPNKSLKKAAIIDVDGTIAEMSGRSPFDWGKVGEDKPKSAIIAMVRGLLYEDYHLIFMSGRDSVCREATEDWILDNVFPKNYDDWEDDKYSLFMRPEGDCRKDSVVKEELFWDNVADEFCVEVVVDDRPVVIDLWNELKIPTVVSVGNQRIKF